MADGNGNLLFTMPTDAAGTYAFIRDRTVSTWSPGPEARQVIDRLFG